MDYYASSYSDRWRNRSRDTGSAVARDVPQDFRSVVSASELLEFIADSP